jgi:small glutamine-rich tetratricopeptide repeat-containing protein alpha
MSNNRKLLVASVLKFLKAEIDSKKITPDQEESLNVASQCLAMAFNTTHDDAADLPDLLQLLTQACPDKMAKIEVSDDQKEQAQKFKNEGNALVKEKKYKEAVEKYTAAINCQESAIFYCNRAAAYTSLENYEEALQDCKKAISFDPDYSKAYSRMGLIYSKIDLYAESENCYEKALKLEPENDSYKKNLEIVKEKLKDQKAAAPAGFPGMPPMGPGGMPDMGNMGAMMEQVMQNPQMRQMAESMLQNPQYQNMMQNMFGGMAGGMPGMPGAEEAAAGAAAAGGMPDFGAAMAGMNPQAMQAGMAMAQQMMQENPEQVEEMRRMMGNMMGGAPPGPPQ